MKKFSGNKKGSKGFYTALGISAVMIGSACYFAYEQGEKITNEFSAKNSVSESNKPVDRQVENVPKITTEFVYRQTTTQSTTRVSVATAPPVETAPPVVTIPSAEIYDYEEQPVYEETESEVESVGAVKLENVKYPLADINEVVGVFSGGELVKSITTGSWQTHNGVDIQAEVGAEVYAISNGEVIEVKNDPVWGVTVLIDHHNGFMTKYCGLSNGLDVQCGDMVISGDLIGTVGNTADIESALSPHLHMELTHNGNYIDPLSALK